MAGLGSRWTYVFVSADYAADSLYTAEVTAFDAAAGTASITTLDRYTSIAAGSTQLLFENHRTTEYRCEGDFLVAVRLEKSQDIDGEPNATAVLTGTYDPPLVVRPVDLVVGDTWTTSSMLTHVDTAGVAGSPVPQEWTSEVVADNVPVDDAMGLSIHKTQNGSASSYAYLQGTGFISDRRYRLTEYTP